MSDRTGSTQTLRAVEGVPVEQVLVGDIVTLPKGMQVKVDDVVFYDHDETYVVKWVAGRQIGSLYPRKAGDMVNVTTRVRR